MSKQGKFIHTQFPKMDLAGKSVKYPLRPSLLPLKADGTPLLDAAHSLNHKVQADWIDPFAYK